MATDLTRERVRRDIEVLARAGLGVGTFLSEAETSLQRAVPNCAACIGTCDPATQLLTGTYKFGDLYGRDERDHQWGLIEYGHVEPTTFTELARADVPGAAIHNTTGGDVARSRRTRDLINPYFGYRDELRVVGCADGNLWGGMALFRAYDDAPFSGAEIAFVTTLSTTLAAALRTGLVASLASAMPPVTTGPVVIIVGRDDKIREMSVGAEDRLPELVHGANAAAPTGTIAALVAVARRYALAQTDVLPRCRVRIRSGQWFVLHASPLASSNGTTGDVVVTIDEARPPEIVPLVVAAFGLTARERDVTHLVLQGVETRVIAATLHMSAYTVQDHLKIVFEKAGVRSRRELLAQVFFDQYVPRLGADLAPSGWFATS